MRATDSTEATFVDGCSDGRAANGVARQIVSSKRGVRAALWLWAALSLGACVPKPPPPVAAPSAPEIPLERVCQEVLPVEPRTIGALVRTLRRMSPSLQIELHPCRAGTEWPIAYATAELEPKSPVGFAVLHMEGDALLTFDQRDREAPVINLCADLDIRLDERHRLRAVGLWESTNEQAFDPKDPDASTAVLAWLELFSRTPGECALGQREPEGHLGEAWMDQRYACAKVPLVVAALPAGCDPVASAPPPAEPPSRDAVVARAEASHRHHGEGRKQAAAHSGLTLEGPETCYFEPPPATRDVCLAVYRDAAGARWYGRGDVTRTGVGGEKNYVDSYLTFQLLKRIEAERKAAGKAPAQGPPGAQPRSPGGPPPASRPTTPASAPPRAK